MWLCWMFCFYQILRGEMRNEKILYVVDPSTLLYLSIWVVRTFHRIKLCQMSEGFVLVQFNTLVRAKKPKVIIIKKFSSWRHMLNCKGTGGEVAPL